MIIQLKEEHIKQIAKIHKENLPSILRYYSLDFIERFYQYQLKENILLGFKEKDEVTGFLFGTYHVEKIYDDFLKENKVYFIRNTLLSTILNPKLVLFFLAKIINKNQQSPKGVQLVYIAIKNTSKGKGIGYQLINAFEKKLQSKGVTYYELEVEKNNKAINFYKKNNFLVFQEYNNWIEKKFLMRKNLI